MQYFANSDRGRVRPYHQDRTLTLPLAGGGLLAAVFDEIHQAFVPGRAFQFTDLLYDSIGMILGCLSATFILLLYQKTKKSKSQ